MRRFIIDTDTASDDAVALLMALRHPDIEVEAITVVAGNCPLDQAVQNALYTVELAGVEVPAYAGATGPMERPLETAQDVHGIDGMGDIGLPLLGRQPAAGDAVDELVARFRSDPGAIELVTLGPLTNVALALEREPALADWVAHCYVMGGTGSGPGNVTPFSEFNFWCDPEAARAVLRSGMSITVVGWDISVASATFDDAEAAELRRVGPLGAFAVDIQAVLDIYAKSETKLAGFDLPDPIAMAVAMEPDMATSAARRIDVLTEDGDRRGSDHQVAEDGSSTRVVTHVPRARFVHLLTQLLREDG